MAILLVLAGLAGGLIWFGIHELPYGLRSRETENVWFESDPSRVYENTICRFSHQYRTNVHPLFPLLAFPAFTVVSKIARLGADRTVDVLLILAAVLWPALMYWLLRLLSFDRATSALMAAAGSLSTVFLLFFSVPETYALSSIGILLALAILHVSENKRYERLGFVSAGVLTFGITVTNWAVALAGTVRARSMKEWIRISAYAFYAVMTLWGVEKVICPSAKFFTELGEEKGYVVRLSPKRIASVLDVMAFHVVIAPAVEQTRDYGINEKLGPAWNTGLTLQNALPGSASPWGIGAVAIWSVVLVLGLSSMARRLGHSRVLFAATAFLVFQVALHSVYGVETFMYGLDWLPLLMIAGAYGFQRLGPGKFPAMLAFLFLLGINNLREFQTVAALVRGFEQAHPVHHALAPVDAIPKDPLCR